MRRRSAGPERAKSRRKTVTQKRHGLRDPSAADHKTQSDVSQLTRERDEALEREKATADVLKVISRSAFDLQTVLNTLVESAARLCEADSASIHRPHNEAYPCIASFGYSAEFEQYLRDHPISPGKGSVLGRVMNEGRTVQVPDVMSDPDHTLVQQRKIGGYRTVLGVPLMRDGLAIGLIRLTRNVVQPFTEKQIELVTTFADQAVIAIENVRLFEAEQQRTRELTESLEQQIATADVLKVISSSPGELEPVFVAMLENAVRICGAKFGVLFRYDGSTFHPAVWRGVPPTYEEDLRRRGSFLPDDGAPLHRLLQTQEVVHTADELAERNPGPAAKVGGARSLIAVPMRKENEFIGAFVVYRTDSPPVH